MSEVREQKSQDAVRSLLELIGEDPKREGLIETPDRVVRSLKELTSGYRENAEEILSKTFEDGVCDEMVVVKDIRFWSLCEHHMLPFYGSVTVGYIPNGKIVGLSKVGRLVHCFARRLQVQERLTQQISGAMMEHLAPRGVGVVVKATHLCMEMRGVRSPAVMVTSSMLGEFRNEHRTRDEFLALARRPKE